jgi:hypothetical protein
MLVEQSVLEIPVLLLVIKVIEWIGTSTYIKNFHPILL